MENSIGARFVRFTKGARLRTRWQAKQMAWPDGGPIAISIKSASISTKHAEIEVADWNVPCGSCVALIGPNGSGKTTLMEAMLGLRIAKTLEGDFFGIPIQLWHANPRLRARLGTQLHNTRLPSGISVRETIELHRALYKRTDPAIVEMLGIDELSDQSYERLSRGQAQRVRLFMALAHHPDLIILDEPFTGLDQKYALSVTQLIEELLRDGSTLVMACHTSEEIALANLVTWIRGVPIHGFSETGKLRQTLLGDRRLRACFSRKENADAFISRLQVQFRPHFIKRDSSSDCVIFGNEELETFARSLAIDDELLSIEVGRTSNTDLLFRCALGVADV
jgi:ABC-2 type transport system ATP-binding protein